MNIIVDKKLFVKGRLILENKIKKLLLIENGQQDKEDKNENVNENKTMQRIKLWKERWRDVCEKYGEWLTIQPKRKGEGGLILCEIGKWSKGYNAFKLAITEREHSQLYQE